MGRGFVHQQVMVARSGLMDTSRSIGRRQTGNRSAVRASGVLPEPAPSERQIDPRVTMVGGINRLRRRRKGRVGKSPDGDSGQPRFSVRLPVDGAAAIRAEVVHHGMTAV